ncbi:MAG TPA: VanZ family protein [Chloroflexi bacterium]|jgi:VanZ family protein|nr:VanZ family protein [Chloroflexota bacterium]
MMRQRSGRYFMDKSLHHRYLLNALFGWLPLILWMAMIFWLSHQPDLPKLNRLIGLSDLLFEISAHASVFAVLTVLAWWAMVTWPADSPALFWRKPIRTAGGLAAVYGISDELHQFFVPGRHASVLDWIVDLAGIAVAMVFLRAVQRRWADHRERSRAAN